MSLNEIAPEVLSIGVPSGWSEVYNARTIVGDYNAVYMNEFLALQSYCDGIESISVNYGHAVVILRESMFMIDVASHISDAQFASSLNSSTPNFTLKVDHKPTGVVISPEYCLVCDHKNVYIWIWSRYNGVWSFLLSASLPTDSSSSDITQVSGQMLESPSAFRLVWASQSMIHRAVVSISGATLKFTDYVPYLKHDDDSSQIARIHVLSDHAYMYSANTLYYMIFDREVGSLQILSHVGTSKMNMVYCSLMGTVLMDDKIDVVYVQAGPFGEIPMSIEKKFTVRVYPRDWIASDFVKVVETGWGIGLINHTRTSEMIIISPVTGAVLHTSSQRITVPIHGTWNFNLGSLGVFGPSGIVFLQLPGCPPVDMEPCTLDLFGPSTEIYRALQTALGIRGFDESYFHTPAAFKHIADFNRSGHLSPYVPDIVEEQSSIEFLLVLSETSQTTLAELEYRLGICNIREDYVDSIESRLSASLLICSQTETLDYSKFLPLCRLYFVHSPQALLPLVSSISRILSGIENYFEIVNSHLSPYSSEDTLDQLCTRCDFLARSGKLNRAIELLCARNCNEYLLQLVSEYGSPTHRVYALRRSSLNCLDLLPIPGYTLSNLLLDLVTYPDIPTNTLKEILKKI